MKFFFTMAGALFGALLLQQFIPPLPWLNGARLLLLPVVFVYCALAFPFPFMLVLAFLSGFMWDALTVQMVEETVQGVAERRFEMSPGWSILVYGALGALANGFRPLYQRGRWEIHCLLSGVCVTFMVLVEYLMIVFRRGEFIFPAEVWWRIGGAGLVAMLVAPMVFLGLNILRALLGANYAGARPMEDGTTIES